MNLPPLPELPEPARTEQRFHSGADIYIPNDVERYFTADQLRAYALSYGRAVQEACASDGGWHACNGCPGPNDCRMHGCGVARDLWKERDFAAIRNGVIREGEGE